MKNIMYTFKIGINKLVVTASEKCPLFGKTEYLLSLMHLLNLQTSTVTENSRTLLLILDVRELYGLSEYVLEVICSG